MNTDGFGGNHGSVIKDCFLKVNDDTVKIYRNNMKAKNLVIYKQVIGAGFQLGWGAYGSAHDCHISDIYIVKDAPLAPDKKSTTGVISLQKNNGSEIKNLVFENFYIDNNVQRTFGIEARGGLVQNIILRNFIIRGKNNTWNYVWETRDTGQVKDIKFENVRINGKCINSMEDFNLRTTGNVKNLIFSGCQ